MKKTQPNGLEVYRRATVIPSQRWGWRLWSQGRIIATSGEGYSSESYAEWMGARVCDGIYAGSLTPWQMTIATRPYLLDGGK